MSPLSPARRREFQTTNAQCLALRIKLSADDKLKYISFFFFFRKQILTFHANCHVLFICKFMFPPLELGDILFSVCLSHTCPLYNLKTVQAIFTKLHIKISINIRRGAERKNHNSCIYTFLSYFPLTLSQNSVRSIT